jgi:hypothetical protein
MALLKLSKRVDEICACFPLYEGGPLFGSESNVPASAQSTASTQS